MKNNEELINNLKKRININYQHAKLVDLFVSNQIYSYEIFEANSDYYFNYTLEERQKLLNAENINCLCKTMILENTAFNKEHESEYYQQYYLCIVQYTKEFVADKIAKYLKFRQNHHCPNNKLSNKFFHFRVAKQEEAYAISGYAFNGITPYLAKCTE